MPGTKLGTRQAQQKGSFFFFIFVFLVVVLFFKAGLALHRERGPTNGPGHQCLRSSWHCAGTVLKQDTRTRVPGSLPPPSDRSVS